MPTYLYRCPRHGIAPVVKPMEQAGGPERCAACGSRMVRAWGAEQKGIIMRPGSYRRRPEDPAYGDFRRELELGEIKDDATPVASPDDPTIAAFDAMPMRLPDDPERTHRLHQVVRQHWTEDLSDDTVRRRELEAAAVRRGEIAP